MSTRPATDSFGTDGLHPRIVAGEHPAQAAVVTARDGGITTYSDLERRSNQLAHFLRRRGLGRGATIAYLTGPGPEFFEISWAAQRAGLYYVPLGYHLTSSEVAHILDDSNAVLLFLGREYRHLLDDRNLADEDADALIIDLDGGPVADYRLTLEAQPVEPIPDESPGMDMLYTSGTTGKPKGVRRRLPDGDIAYAHTSETFYPSLGFDRHTVYLPAGPLYHSSPLHTCMQTMSRGGACVLVERFDAEAVLATIERYQVTHANFVPTHFVRLLRLPEPVRKRYDLSSLRTVMHGAAPCPVWVKEQMIDWLGPIITEFYGGTEAVGGASIDSHEWLAHKGSVGRSNRGPIHIVDEATGAEQPVGTDGVIYFENPPPVEYTNDAEATRRLFSRQGWGTLGDIGHVDTDGYLYLVDRRSNLIISGGVNVYPQEAENRLLQHPDVQDAAVFGVPSEEFGERVCAVVAPMFWPDDETVLERDLIAFCRATLSAAKCPRSIVFEVSVPRGGSGKLHKRLIREKYLARGGPES